MLLIDEVDRADDEFEAFLFELLAEGSVTIPELGTRRATVRPVAILTSNRTRDLHDALKRRCLYHWIRYPSRGPGGRHHPPPGARRVRSRWPSGSPRPSSGCATSTSTRRPASPRRSLGRRAGGARSVHWDVGAAERTLGAVLKYDEDLAAARDAGLATVLGDELTEAST